MAHLGREGSTPSSPTILGGLLNHDDTTFTRLRREHHARHEEDGKG